MHFSPNYSLSYKIMRTRLPILQIAIIPIRFFTILAGFLFCSPAAKAQDTAWVACGDMRFLRKEIPNGRFDWDFREGVPDGYYCLYLDSVFMGSRLVAALREPYSEVTIRNGKKEGIERLHRGNHDLLTIPWKSGKREGIATHINYRGEIKERYTYHNNELNGRYERYADGVLFMTGSFKNGFCDGVWTIYRSFGKEKNAVKTSILAKYRFVNGIIRLTDVWDINGRQLLRNEKTLLGDSLSETGLSSDGFQNGRLIDRFEDGKLASEEVFKQGRLVSVKKFDPDGKPIIEASYIYTRQSKVDTEITTKSSFCFQPLPLHNEVSRTDTPIRNGSYVKYYFRTGKVLCEGDFDSGRVKGKWTCYYDRGEPKTTVDGESNVWQHYDRRGKVTSDAKVEYYSTLSGYSWHSGNSLGDSVFVLDRYVRREYDYFYFKASGELECTGCNCRGSGYMPEHCYYSLIADTLTAKQCGTSYSYKITYADDFRVSMTLVKRGTN